MPHMAYTRRLSKTHTQTKPLTVGARYVDRISVMTPYAWILLASRMRHVEPRPTIGHLKAVRCS